ncbi:MAG TPA: DPP IV N-terminal domain-containing protein [Terriglobales bacterium]|nr:DPP IV N-terminal domain-containing protein [Terriglobales bacterium]
MKKCLFVFTINLLVLLSAGRAQTAAPKQLTIEQIFAEGGVTGRAPETIKWSPDGAKVSFVQRDDAGEHGELWYVDATTGEKKILASETKLSQLAPPPSKIKDEREKERVTRYHVAAYIWSPDSKHLLFDAKGQLWYYSLDTGTAVPLTSSPDPSQDPKFSPDGKRLAYVRKHNLYVHPVSGEEGERPLTREEKEKDKDKDRDKDKDKEDNILNGEVDWVYAEELAVRSNFFWSPKGHEIIFLQMDESRVPAYPITDWLPTHPRVEQEKYPKAGDPNPSVRLGVVGGNGGKVRWIKLTDDDDTYVPRFGWIREGWAWAEVLNRKQDVMDLYFIDAKSGKSRKVLTESAPDAWVNVNDDFRILKSGDRFLWTSWRDGHTHIYLYSFNAQDPMAADAKLERQLESGDYEVIEISGVDEASGAVFFTANKGDPRQEKLFSVKLDGSGMQGISSEEGNYAANFADDGKHFVETHSATLTPPRISVCAAGGPCQKIWEARSVDDYNPIAPKPLEFKAEDGTVLYGYLILPRHADTSQKIPIPLIVNIYGGPAGQTVQDAWGGTTSLFHQILANEGFAIFSVDNRGTPNRGKKFSAAIRLQSGPVELKDQLTALDQLYAQVPQLDRTRTAIWGWSNGGSMTLYALTHSDRFKAGISVAPVTSWHNYDSIYTERYMGLLKNNASGYDDSIVGAASSLHGSLLLVHGTSDDNVHFQNTIQMTDALIKAGKQFRLMMYPNKTHGIAGPGTRTQLFHMMEDFWNKELK